MRQKKPCFVVTYHTTAEAMATEKLCTSLGLPGRLIPAPRSVSADCGIAWCCAVEDGKRVCDALEAAGIDTAGAGEMLL